MDANSRTQAGSKPLILSTHRARTYRMAQEIFFLFFFLQKQLSSAAALAGSLWRNPPLSTMAFKHTPLLPAIGVARKILEQFWGVMAKTGEKKPQLMGSDTELCVGFHGLAPSVSCACLCMSLQLGSLIRRFYFPHLGS